MLCNVCVRMLLGKLAKCKQKQGGRAATAKNWQHGWIIAFWRPFRLKHRRWRRCSTWKIGSDKEERKDERIASWTSERLTDVDGAEFFSHFDYLRGAINITATRQQRITQIFIGCFFFGLNPGKKKQATCATQNQNFYELQLTFYIRISLFA